MADRRRTMSYTVLAIVGVAIAVAFDLVVLRTRLLTRRAFWTGYGIVLFFQLLLNGLLTGIPIVQYNSDAIIGWRIAYAPVEDLLFGFALILVTLSAWVANGRRTSLGDHGDHRAADRSRTGSDRR